MRTLSRPTAKWTAVEAQFSTLLMKRQFEDVAELKRALSELMLRLEKETRNIADDTSNIGGYHSDTKLRSRPEPEIAVLREMVSEAIREFTTRFIEENCSAPDPRDEDRPLGLGDQHARG